MDGRLVLSLNGTEIKDLKPALASSVCQATFLSFRCQFGVAPWSHGRRDGSDISIQLSRHFFMYTLSIKCVS